MKTPPKLLDLLFGPGNSCTNDPGKLFLSDAEQHRDSHVQNSNHSKRKPGKEPELNTNVLLRARSASPMSYATLLTDSAQTAAGVANLGTLRPIWLGPLVQAGAMSGTISGACGTAIC